MMTKVYVVIIQYYHDNGQLAGIYTNEQAANLRARELEEKAEHNYGDVRIIRTWLDEKLDYTT